MTPADALAQAERLEAEARRLREFASAHRNPGLLPDEDGYVPEQREAGHDHELHAPCWAGCPAQR